MSNVLVIHPDDRSTDMLKAVYAGKGYDVINDSRIKAEDLRKAIEEHDTIIMLGHGTHDGLVSIDRAAGRFDYIIHDGHAELLKTKKTYSMWCHSDAYFRRHGMHGFHSGMIISEEMEALMYGIRRYSDADICESMMPLMYAMHDTLERYNATDPVTLFNRRNILIL